MRTSKIFGVMNQGFKSQGRRMLATMFCAGVFFIPSFGQKSVLDDTSKTYIRQWKASLTDLQKPEIAPPVPPIKVETEPVKFEEKEFSAPTVYTPPPPRVKKPEQPVWPALYNNFIKVGFGRYRTPIGKLYLHNGRSTTTDAGLEFSHISAAKGPVDFSEFREDYGTANVQYLMKNNAVGAKFHFFNNSYYYYADTIVENNPDLKDTISQNFSRLSVDAFIRSHTQVGSVNYQVPVQFRYWFDKYKDRDLHFSLMPQLKWTISERFGAELDVVTTFSNTTIDSVTQSRIFFDFTPTVSMKLEKLSVNAGLKVASFTDTNNIFVGIPVVQAEYHLVPGKFNLKAGLRGDMINNTFYDLTGVNKYLALQNNIKPTLEKLNLHFGADGNFANWFNFSAKVYYKNIDNQPLFFNTAEGAYFNIIYDNNFKEMGTELSLNFSKGDKIKSGVTGNFRKFTTSNDSLFNFGIPATKVKVWGSYNFSDKVWVTSEIFLYGKRTMSLDTLMQPITQDFQADINLHLEYRFSKRISLFLDLNNLLGNKYYRWDNYLERPFDIKGGVTASF